MNWYCELSSFLKDDNVSSMKLRDELEKRILNLYESLLSYLLKSVCSYFQNRIIPFLQDMIKRNDWDGNVKAIQNAENAVRHDFDVYSNIQKSSYLKKLVECAELSENTAKTLLQTCQEQILKQMADKERRCLWDLRLIDSRDEIKKIEDRKDPLFKDSFAWILDCEQYKNFMNWEDGNKHRLLWVKGDAGKGKTMLLIGVIKELERLNLNPNSPNLSYFFCQRTDSMLNTPTAILRCLIWLMLVQQPSLISYIEDKYATAGPDVFKDNNAFYFLRDAFKNMLKNNRVKRIFLVVDALDECIDKDKPRLAQILDLISATVATSPNIKWLVSSRNRPDIESRLGGSVRLDLELNPECIRNAVSAYIDHKLSELDKEKQYKEEVRLQIAEELRKKADGTFLWVALVCKALESEESYYALDVLREMPSDLKELYKYMMRQIKELKRDDPKYCKTALSIMTLVYQPLHLSELAILASLPIHIPITEIIKKCTSFLTERNDIVYFVHQSANDYLTKDAESEILPDGCAKGHVRLLSNGINVMSNMLGGISMVS